MTTQKQIYNTLEDAKIAKARNRIDHKLDEPKHTNLLSDGRYEVVWVLPDDPLHSKNRVEPPKRQLTKTELQAEMEAEYAKQHNIEVR